MGPGSFSLTVLGSDGSFPGPGGACSGYLVRGGGKTLWLDAGPGTMSNVQRHIALEDLDAVVVSHEHPDHWSDLEGLAVAFKWALRRTGPQVFAPTGIRELMRVGHSVDSLPWDTIRADSKIGLGGMLLTFSRTDHPVLTLAVRIECGGRVLGYSADTGPGWQLAELGDDLDLAVCEATFLADKEGTVQHMSARQAGTSAAAAGVARLLITHLTPGVDRDEARREAAESFGAPVEVAEIDARYEV